MENYLRSVVNKIQLSEVEFNTRKEACNIVTNKLYSIFPKSNIILFGSYPSNFSLSGSDIDLSLNGCCAAKKFCLNDMNLIKQVLRASNVQQVDRVLCKVSLLKFEENGINFDLSFNNVTNNNTTKYFLKKAEEFDTFHPLVLLIKQMTALKKLNKPVDGGMGNFRLQSLILQHLELQSKNRQPSVLKDLMSFLKAHSTSDVNFICDNPVNGAEISGNVSRLDEIIQMFKTVLCNLENKNCIFKGFEGSEKIRSRLQSVCYKNTWVQDYEVTQEHLDLCKKLSLKEENIANIVDALVENKNVVTRNAFKTPQVFLNEFKDEHKCHLEYVRQGNVYELNILNKKYKMFTEARMVDGHCIEFKKDADIYCVYEGKQRSSVTRRLGNTLMKNYLACLFIIFHFKDTKLYSDLQYIYKKSRYNKRCLPKITHAACKRRCTQIKETRKLINYGHMLKVSVVITW